MGEVYGTQPPNRRAVRGGGGLRQRPRHRGDDGGEGGGGKSKSQLKKERERERKRLQEEKEAREKAEAAKVEEDRLSQAREDPAKRKKKIEKQLRAIETLKEKGGLNEDQRKKVESEEELRKELAGLKV